MKALMSPLFLITILIFSTTTATAQQRIETELTLEDVPVTAVSSDAVTLKGRLVRADTGKGIPKVAIILNIKSAMDPKAGEEFVVGTSDDEGRFAIKWRIEAEGKQALIIYASYMGSDTYSSASSKKYTVIVESMALSVETNKERFTTGDQLIISGSTRPNDTLSVFLTTTAGEVFATTKIIVDETGLFRVNLIEWDNSYDTGPYLIHVRSRTDVESSERLLIHFAKTTIREPQGIETVLTFDKLQAVVTLRDNLLFAGRLDTRTDLPIMDATILVKYKEEEDGAEDGLLAQGTTLGDGMFFINWQAFPVNAKDSLNIYAIFEGGNGFLPSVSPAYEIRFKPRELTLETNADRFLSNDPLIVSGIAPPGEWLDIRLADPEGQTAVSKSVFVSSEGGYEVKLMRWTKPSYVLPEGNYEVVVETRNEPVLEASRILTFERDRPLAQYNLTGSVLYEDTDGNELGLGGARVTISGTYGEVDAYTDPSGKYVFRDLDSLSENVGSVLSIKVDLEGEHFRLIDGSTSMMLSKRITSTVRLDGGMHDVEVEPLVFSGKFEMAGARIFVFQNEIVRFYTDVIGVDPEKIDIEIFSSETPKGKFGYLEANPVPRIWIGKSVSSPRHPYTWDTLAHEYTHHMQHLYASVDHYQSMNHGGFANPTTADSMVEGFANFMSGAISQHHGTEQAGKFLRHSLEFDFEAGPEYLAEELAVAGLFWDLYDQPSGGDDDEVSLSIETIWDIMSTEYDFPSYNKHFPGEKRHVYYIKDLHYVLTEGPYSNRIDPEKVEEVFASHGAIDGLADPDRPHRV